jgi:hypothetical protein
MSVDDGIRAAGAVITSQVYPGILTYSVLVEPLQDNVCPHLSTAGAFELGVV